MAKILLIAEKLSPTTLRLAGALRSQQHQVMLLSSRGETGVLPEGVELLGYFDRWSVTEAIKLTPMLYGLQPQILHFVLEEDRLNAAQVVLGLLAKGLPHCVLTTSLLHIRRGLRRRNPVRYLLLESDIITCPSVEALGSLRGLNVKSLRQGRGILPPALDLSTPTEEVDDGSGFDLEKSLAGRDYLVLPFFESCFDPHRASFRRLTLLASHRHTVLMGTWSSWSVRDRKKFQAWMQNKGLAGQWSLTGELNLHHHRRLLAGSEALVLAGLSLTPLETTEYFLRTIQSKTTLVLDERQAAIHSDLWKNGDNCWILPVSDLNSRLQDLLSKGTLRRPQALAETISINRELVDAPLNELNRLYNKALSQKHILR